MHFRWQATSHGAGDGTGGAPVNGDTRCSDGRVDGDGGKCRGGGIVGVGGSFMLNKNHTGAGFDVASDYHSKEEVAVTHDCCLGGDDSHGRGRVHCRDERVYSPLVVVYSSTGGKDWGMMASCDSNLFRAPVSGSLPVPLLSGALVDGWLDAWRVGGIHRVLGVGVGYEDGECTDGEATLANFKGAVDTVLRYTIFELVGMGTNCGCKKHSSSFDWKGAGSCRVCLVGTGLLIDGETVDSKVNVCPDWWG